MTTQFGGMPQNCYSNGKGRHSEGERRLEVGDREGHGKENGPNRHKKEEENGGEREEKKRT